MSARAGQTLVAMLAVIVIIAILAAVFLKGGGENTRKDGVGKTIIGQTKAAAQDDVCRSNLGQVRMSIQVQTDPVENTFPTDLKSLKLGDDFTRCPLGKEPYVYDPQTGKVHCVHLGHEKY